MKINRLTLGLTGLTLATSLSLMACSSPEKPAEKGVETKVEASATSPAANVQQADKATETEGDKVTKILASHLWQGSSVIGEDGSDLTAYNKDFISIARFDADTNRYEFFDPETGKTREDAGVFFITPDGKRRVHISQTKNYQAALPLTEVTDEIFTYARMGKDAQGNEVPVQVKHLRYTGQLAPSIVFSNPVETGVSPKPSTESRSGNEILGSTLWQGTKVVDENGKDLTEFNRGFISIARFDDTSGRYEFFQTDNGESRGDMGYFAVVNHDSERAHVNLGEKRYGAVLKLTELTPQRFTYTRMGKDAQGNDVVVFVEHEPYKGSLQPSFTELK